MQHHALICPGNVQRFRGGLVCKAHRLCVALNSRLESNKEEDEDLPGRGERRLEELDRLHPGLGHRPRKLRPRVALSDSEEGLCVRLIDFRITQL